MVSQSNLREESLDKWTIPRREYSVSSCELPTPITNHTCTGRSIQRKVSKVRSHKSI